MRDTFNSDRVTLRIVRTVKINRFVLVVAEY
jgi:hypothetical protein